jgi:hypothetical protein
MSSPDFSDHFTADVIFVSEIEQNRKPSPSNAELKIAKTSGSENTPAINESDSYLHRLHDVKQGARITVDSSSPKENIVTPFPGGSSQDSVEVSVLA